MDPDDAIEVAKALFRVRKTLDSGLAERIIAVDDGNRTMGARR